MLDKHSYQVQNGSEFGGMWRPNRRPAPYTQKHQEGGTQMTLTRCGPVSGLAAMEIDRLSGMFEAARQGEPVSPGAWVPPVDIVETAEKNVVVRVELPDMRREDIKVTFENDVLTI